MNSRSFRLHWVQSEVWIAIDKFILSIATAMVDFKALKPLKKPVTLAQVKATPELAKMSLVTSMRLSVQPVTPAEWKLVCKMGGL